MIDNYDSFVYNLVHYLRELHSQVVVRRNDDITLAEIEAMKPEGIVLSPGPKAPKDAPLCVDIVKHFKGKVPILGICLGYQVIIEAFGGKVIEGKEPVHGKVHAIEHDDQGVFAGIKNPVNVTRYHSLVADSVSIPEELIVTSKTDDGVVMGVRHMRYPIEGVQFHPEAVLTECGHQMLQNFLKRCL